MQFIKVILTVVLLTICISVTNCEEIKKVVEKGQVVNSALANPKSFSGDWKGFFLEGRDSIPYEFFDVRINKQENTEMKKNSVELKSKSIHFEWHFYTMVCRAHGYSFRKSFDSLIVAQIDRSSCIKSESPYGLKGSINKIKAGSYFLVFQVQHAYYKERYETKFVQKITVRD